MKNYSWLLVLLVVFFFVFAESAFFIFPFIFAAIIFITVFKVIGSIKANAPQQTLYPKDPNLVFESEHDLVHTYTHPEDDGFYDPTLIDAFRYVDYSNANKTTMTLTNVKRTKQLAETLMFINEGEQVILSRGPSLFGSVGVYDRSKTLLGYIPKVRNSAVNQMMIDKRLYKIQITRITKTILGYIIQIELTYKA